MALKQTAAWATWDALTQRVAPDDMSVYLLAAMMQPHEFIGRINIGAEIQNVVGNWMEQTINPDSFTANNQALANNAGAAIDIPNSMANLVHEGYLLVDTTAGVQEVLQVTNVGAADSGDTGAGNTKLDITRAYMYAANGGGYAEEAHGAYAKYLIISANQQASGPYNDRTRYRTRRSNKLETFDTDIIIAGDVLATKFWNVANEYENSLQARAVEIKRDMMRAVILGVMSGDVSDSIYGTMGGIRQYIKQTANGATWGTPAPTANSTYDNTSETLTYDVFSDMAGAMYDNGVGLDATLLAVCGRDLYETCGKWPQDQFRREEVPEIEVGHIVDVVRTRQGYRIPLMLDNYIPKGEMLITDLDRLFLRPEAGYAWKTYTQPLGFARNDFAAARMLGKWTLEIHNPDKAHSLHTNLAAA